jgi:thioesterase domain-containing protein
MHASVVSVTPESTTLSAPLDPNLNHRETAFGGSVAALAILSGWTHVHFKLSGEGFETYTVIQDSSVRYDKPIEGPFVVKCGDIDPEEWSRFVRMLSRKGKARIHVGATIESGGEVAGSFKGAYVAILR